MPAFVGTRRALLGGGADTFNGNPYSFYSLLDIFSDTRAAGSVNGTLPVVGGARVVTDTNSVLSILGGVANFATGGPGAGDPGLWYSTQARVFGKTLLGVMSFAQTTKRIQFGWDTDQALTTSPGNSWFFDSNGTFGPGTTGEGPVSGVYTATTYNLAVTLRSSGAYFFIKGGAFTNWTLAWIGSLPTTTPLFPAAVSFSNIAGSFTADNIRVPVSLYIPTPLAYDTFTRADGALGNSQTTGPDTQATPSLAWTGTTYTISTNKAINTPTLGAEVIVNGGFGTDTDWNKGADWTIAAGLATAVTASSDLTAAVAPLVVGTWYSVTYTLSGFGAGTVNAKLGSTAFPTHAANATYTETGLALTTAFAFTGVGFTGSIDDVSCKPLTLAELFATIVPSTPDVMLDINCTMVGALTGKQLGIVSNLDSAATPANFRLTTLDGRGNVVVYDCIAGTYTVKATTAITYSAASPLRVVLSSTALSRFYNSALVGTTQTMGANTNTLCGLFSTSPLSSQDFWQAFAVGTADSNYSGLNSF